VEGGGYIVGGGRRGQDKRLEEAALLLSRISDSADVERLVATCYFLRGQGSLLRGKKKRAQERRKWV